MKGSNSTEVLVICYDCYNFDSGVAYSKHIVHLFSYNGADDLRNHLEVCVVDSPSAY